MFHRKQSMRLIAYLPCVDNGSNVESFTAKDAQEIVQRLGWKNEDFIKFMDGK